MSVTKIGLVDDHAVLRQSLKLYLSREKDIEIIGDWGTAEECIEFIKDGNRPDIILMDNHLPGMTGIKAVKAVKEIDGNINILMLSISTNPEDVINAFKYGVSGYTSKSSPVNELLANIKKIQKGDTVIHPEIAVNIVKYSSKKQKNTLKEELTPEEVEVLEMSAMGYSYKEISDRVGKSLSVTKSLVRQVLTKFDARNRAHAVALAIKMGKIDIEKLLEKERNEV